jgi:Carbohydrate esterase, sialic acid-specific acetylesterase
MVGYILLLHMTPTVIVSTPNTPPANEVYAMDYEGKGHINIAYTSPNAGVVKVVLVNLKTPTVQIPVELTKSGNDYSAQLHLPKGEYEYYFTDTSVTNITQTKYNFSVGLVFVIAGHSLGSSNGEKWGTSNKVRLVEGYEALTANPPAWRDETKYKGQTYFTAKEIYTQKLALPNANDYDLGIGAWTTMAEKIALRDDVTVAIINCAMGGSSVEMWADEAMSRPFVHGFGSPDPNNPTTNLYNSGIPYFHFENVLKHIGKRTGVTAVLVQHGENDMQKPKAKLAGFYKEFIEKARTASGLTKVPFVLAKSAWLLGGNTTQAAIDETLASVDEAIKITPQTFVGIDTHLLAQSFRGQPNNPNDGHWNQEGSKEVGKMWADKLTPAFLQEINLASKSPVAPTTPVSPLPIEIVAQTVEKVQYDNVLGIAIALGTMVLMFFIREKKKTGFFRKLSLLGIGVIGLGTAIFYHVINYFKNKKNA